MNENMIIYDEASIVTEKMWGDFSDELGYNPYNHQGRYFLPKKDREDLAAWLEEFDEQCEDLRTKIGGYLGRTP